MPWTTVARFLLHQNFFQMYLQKFGYMDTSGSDSGWDIHDQLIFSFRMVIILFMQWRPECEPRVFRFRPPSHHGVPEIRRAQWDGAGWRGDWEDDEHAEVKKNSLVFGLVNIISLNMSFSQMWRERLCWRRRKGEEEEIRIARWGRNDSGSYSIS